MEGKGNSNLASKFDTSGGVLVGDKFTSRKKTNDVRENLVKTEAMQDLGNIRSKVRIYFAISLEKKKKHGKQE